MFVLVCHPAAACMGLSEVIVDGHPSCMPLSVSTVADRLSAAGWATSAYGKWVSICMQHTAHWRNLCVDLQR